MPSSWLSSYFLKPKASGLLPIIAAAMIFGGYSLVSLARQGRICQKVLSSKRF